MAPATRGNSLNHRQHTEAFLKIIHRPRGINHSGASVGRLGGA